MVAAHAYLLICRTLSVSARRMQEDYPSRGSRVADRWQTLSHLAALHVIKQRYAAARARLGLNIADILANQRARASSTTRQPLLGVVFSRDREAGLPARRKRAAARVARKVRERAHGAQGQKGTFRALLSDFHSKKPSARGRGRAVVSPARSVSPAR